MARKDVDRVGIEESEERWSKRDEENEGTTPAPTSHCLVTTSCSDKDEEHERKCLGGE